MALIKHLFNVVLEFGKMSKSRAGCGEVMRQILIASTACD